MSKLTLVVSNYTPIGKHALVGKVDVHITELRLTACGVLVLETHGKRWASLPSPAMLDKDGKALRDDRGKIRYANAFTFDTKEIRNAFSEAVIAAVIAAYPDAFEEAAR